ncbi:MAG: hypothetical protein ABI353_00050 [Isosphaeraceae bacterium]
MPKTSDQRAIAALSEQMLDILEARRTQNNGDYPPTLRRLGELCGDPPLEQVLKAVAKKNFTAKASVIEKVDKKPSLDSPVYFKEDVPKKPKPRGESAAERNRRVSAELAGRMVAVLESQRRLGDDAYPPTLRRLAVFCGLTNGPDSQILKATEQDAMVERAVVVARAGKKPHLDAPVLLLEDLESGAGSPALLRFVLRPPAQAKNQTHAFTPEELAKRFIPEIQEPFHDAVVRGVAREDLPPEVAWVAIKGKPHLFLLENLRPVSTNRVVMIQEPASLAPPPPERDATSPTSAQSARDFAEAFRETFAQLDVRNGSTNYVKLSVLRRELPEFGREAFDDGLRQLRLDGQFSLDSHEGSHNSLSPEDREAGIREAGTLLIYAFRR